MNKKRAISQFQSSPLGKCFSIFLLICFFVSTTLVPAHAQEFLSLGLNLPQVGSMVHLSQGYTPAMIKGIKLFEDNPLQFDFILDAGESGLNGQALKNESEKLIKYFLASLAVPEEDLWVNLSPYEKDRIIPEDFGVTEMGRDMLAQDYLLKQITASLMYPEDDLGNEFWERVQQKVFDKYGKTEIPTNIFNKVWILPEKAVVYVHGDSAFVVDSRLKVMLEKDYLASQNNNSIPVSEATSESFRKDSDPGRMTLQALQEIILPEIEKEVNNGKHFAQLRQIYHSMILATWFKRNLQENILGKVYVGQNKIEGVDVHDKEISQKIYTRYLDAFQTGVYNYIKEEYNPATQEIIPRKYFSGGIVFNVNEAMIVTKEKKWGRQALRNFAVSALTLFVVSTGINLITPETSQGAIFEQHIDSSNSTITATVEANDLPESMIQDYSKQVKNMALSVEDSIHLTKLLDSKDLTHFHPEQVFNFDRVEAALESMLLLKEVNVIDTVQSTAFNNDLTTYFISFQQDTSLKEMYSTFYAFQLDNKIFINVDEISKLINTIYDELQDPENNPITFNIFGSKTKNEILQIILNDFRSHEENHVYSTKKIAQNENEDFWFQAFSSISLSNNPDNLTYEYYRVKQEVVAFLGQIASSEEPKFALTMLWWTSKNHSLDQTNLNYSVTGEITTNLLLEEITTQLKREGIPFSKDATFADILLQLDNQTIKNAANNIYGQLFGKLHTFETIPYSQSVLNRFITEDSISLDSEHTKMFDSIKKNTVASTSVYPELDVRYFQRAFARQSRKNTIATLTPADIQNRPALTVEAATYGITNSKNILAPGFFGCIGTVWHHKKTETIALGHHFVSTKNPENDVDEIMKAFHDRNIPLNEIEVSLLGSTENETGHLAYRINQYIKENQIPLNEAQFNLFEKGGDKTYYINHETGKIFRLKQTTLQNDTPKISTHDTTQNQKSEENVGGIDFNPNNLLLETKGEGIKFNVPFDLQNLESSSVTGASPVILQITPITNLPLLLGISEEEGSKENSLQLSQRF
ncbi:hypothetical protein ACFL49_01460 [Candidatus Omnitrophota bacterium]